MAVGPTLSELDRRVRSGLSESTTGYFSSQNVLDWLNEAQDIISSECPWTVPTVLELSDTVRYGDSYMMPPEVLRVDTVEVRLTNGNPVELDLVPPDWLKRKKTFNNRISGTPQKVAIQHEREGVAIEIYPVPAEIRTILVRCYLRPTALSALTDRTDVPPQVAQAMVAYARWQAKIKDEEGAEADRAQSEWVQKMRDLKAERFTAQVRAMTTAYGKSFYPTPGFFDGGLS